MHIRAAQRWVKRYYESLESIFGKKNKSGRHRILGEEYKQLLLNCIDENPSAIVSEVVESLKQKFEGLNVSLSTVYNFMTTRCNLSVKQAQFHPVGKIQRGKDSTKIRLWSKSGSKLTWISQQIVFFLINQAFHISWKRIWLGQRKAFLQ